MTIQPTRVRTRTPATNTPSAGGGGGWMKTGASARDAASQELVRQREQAERRANGLYMPFRFWVPVGESREVVILDAELGPCFYEHQLQNPRTGKWDIHETCPKEWENCPLCDGTGSLKGKDSYYVMMLTVMDLTPYTTKDGKEVPHSRKLLPVKAQQQPFFVRQLDRHGTLRGLQLLMSRDTNQTASIGNPEFVELHTEEALLQSFGHAAITGQDGKVIKEANADCFSYPYDKLFKRPEAEDLRKRYGGAAPSGSRQEEQEVWGEPAGGTDKATSDLADDIPW